MSKQPKVIMVTGKILYYVPPVGEYVEAESMLNLINEYNEYIQKANNENRYENGWCPISISEFYHYGGDDRT